jgi:hypothetical protein
MMPVALSNNLAKRSFVVLFLQLDVLGAGNTAGIPVRVLAHIHEDNATVEQFLGLRRVHCDGSANLGRRNFCRLGWQYQKGGQGYADRE